MRSAHLRSFASNLAAAIWPLADTCVLCGRTKPISTLFDAPVCLACLTTVMWWPGWPCVRCGRPLPDGGLPRLCPTCQSAEEAEYLATAVDRSVALGVYQGRLATYIRRLKYDGQSQLGEPLGNLLGAAVASRFGPPPEDTRSWRAVVVPVPLHAARQAERGYNQAVLLSEGVADALDLPLVPKAITRVKSSTAQAGLDRFARLNALAGAFTCDPPEGLAKDAARAIEGKDVLLVDDVLTTGATLAACGAALRHAGARRVFGCVVAVGINRLWWGTALGAAGIDLGHSGMTLARHKGAVVPRDINRQHRP